MYMYVYFINAISARSGHGWPHEYGGEIITRWWTFNTTFKFDEYAIDVNATIRTFVIKVGL